jgi:hypothetical protein
LFEHNKNIIHALIAPFYGLYSTWDHWFHKELHWCPKCMEGGFHSWLLQFKPADKCAFHNLNLIKSCPDCNETIPFLLSNKQLGYAFRCKCGFPIGSFHISSWNEWKGPEQLDQAVLEWIKSNMHQLDVQPKRIVHEQHCNLKLLLLKGKPKETNHFDSIEPIHPNDYYSKRFRTKLFRNYSQACRKVEDRLFQNLLGNHQHCITQLIELRKMIWPNSLRFALMHTHMFFGENLF